MTWNVDTTAKRLIAFSALILVLAPAVPIIRHVHGQQPRSAIEFEFETLRKQVESQGQKLESLPVQVALVIEHQKVEDQRYNEEVGFLRDITLSLGALTSGLFIALFGWLLHQFGITIGRDTSSPERKRHA